MYISSGGVANGTVVNENGELDVFEFGTANSTTVYSGGEMHVFSAGTATSTVVNNAGRMSVGYGGEADVTIVNNGGSLFIRSGGTASNVVWTPFFGTVTAERGALLTFDPSVRGVYLGFDCTLLSSALTMSGATLSGHSMYVMNSGAATSTTVSSGGFLRVFSGGVASVVTLSSGGVLSNFGIVSGMLDFGPSAVVYGGGRFHLDKNTRIAGGVAGQTQDQALIGESTFSNFVAKHDWHVEQPLLLKEATVASDGVLTFHAGASATLLYVAGDAVVLSGANARSATVFSGGLLSVDGGLAAMVTIEKDGDEILVNSGAALRTSVYGRQHIRSGGTANSTTVYRNGTQIVSEFGFAYGDFVSDGGNQLVDGGSSYRANILPGGSQVVQSGGTATEATVTAGHQYVYDEGLAESTTVVRGSQYIYDRGVASTTTITGVMTSQSAELTSSYHYTGDRIYWTREGDVTTVISRSWHANEDSSTKVYYYEYSGSQFVMSGGMAFDTLLGSGAIQTVFSGGIASDTTVDADAFQYVLKDGSAFNTTVSSGGICAVEYDGYGENITVKNGGAIAVHGTVRNLRIAENAAYYFDTGTAVFQGDLDCYISTTDVDTLNEILVFSELDTLTLRVKASEFKLDQYNTFSTAYNGKIGYNFVLVLDNGDAVSMNDARQYFYNGESYTVEYDGSRKTYSFKKFVDNVPPAKPTASADVTTTTNGEVTVTATFSNDSIQKQYSLDNQTWQEYTTGVVFNANGTAYFRGIDVAGNISEVTTYTVANIINVGPAKPTATADITAATNQNVTVTATFSNDSVVREYSLDNSTWQTYTTGVVFNANGIVYFRGTNATGNVSEVTNYAVTNIDRTAPVKPTAQADVTTATNQSVTVTATFSSDSVVKEYSLDNRTWKTYTTGIVMSQNGTVYFRGVDEAGNISDVTSYAVSNITTVGPAKPIATADITAATNKNVTVTAAFSANSVVREYSLDKQTWQTYTTGVILTGNGKIYFRAADEAGNVSDVTEYEVANIDKVAPTKPTAQADVTTATNDEVTVTATFSNDTATKQYSTDNQTWNVYTTGVVMSANGTVFFRGIDAAGNVSDVTSYVVQNILTPGAEVLSVSANVTTPTNNNVTVIAVFGSDTATKQYSFDNANWKTYDSGVTMTANGTVYFRGLNAEGTPSEVKSYSVTNIDKVAPTKPTAKASTTAATNQNVTVTAAFSADSVVKEYSLDNSTWQEYTTGVVFNTNGSVYFRGVDEAGNISDVASYTVSNIDRVAPTKPSVKASTTAPTNQSVTVTATFSNDTTTKQYSTDNKTWKTYTTGIVMSANGTVFFRGTDAAGNVSEITSYTVANIIVTNFSTDGTVAPGKDASFSPKLEATGLYTVSGTFKGKGTVTVVDKTGKKVASGTVKNGVITFKNALLLDNSNSYKVVVKNTDKKGSSIYSVKLAAKELFTKGDTTDNTLKGAKTLAAGTIANDWVGYGDAVDYYKLGGNAAGGIYALNISGVRNNVKLTVYTKNGIKVKSVTASAKKPNIPLADLCLDSGSYAVIEAPKAAKAQNSDYALKLTEKATFKRSNNDWSHAEALTPDATFTGALSKAAGGDTVDYCDVSALGNLSFKTTAGKVKVSFFDTNKQAVKVAVKVAGGKDKTAAAVSLASGKTDNFTIGTLPGSVKYLKIEAAGKTLNSYTIGKIA
jgi:autotransporter passenger strand-loop-strand repeat protein